MTLRWPLDILPPREIVADIAPRSMAAPAAVSGVQQVVASDAGLWKVAFGGIPVVNGNAVLTWRAIAATLEGRIQPILVPLSHWYQPEPPNAEALGLWEPVGHSDNTRFTDGTGYRGSVNDVRLLSAVASRAVSAMFNVYAAGAKMQPGQIFSLGERLYRLRTVTWTSATVAAVTFRPPAREAAVAGQRVELDDPVCRMRLASDAEMDLPLDYGRWSFPTVNFIEDV